jgi:serine/threonine-protein kinase
MSRDGDLPVDSDQRDAPLDDDLARILEAYLASLEAGRPPDAERLLAEHPALAGRLRDCLAVMQMAHRLAESSGAGAAAGSGRGCAQLGDTASASGRSVLATLRVGSDELPQVHLRDLPDEPEPLVRPGFDAISLLHHGGFSRYQLQGEIARGGMGAILKGRDVDLGRDLAIKVLLESHQGNPEVVRRFIEEAQIGGQLQHPGIVPVFELGTVPDRRPYFAMKLVKGRTLAALLAERVGRASPERVGRGSPDPALRPTEGLHSDDASAHDDLPRFLSIFEAVCQTMAYAHARGVIHRDLKPSNIMVGSFGEVQVMDWGLAKVLPEGGIADEARARGDGESMVKTVRSGPAGSRSDSQAGSVLGTPAYMAPEQARGEVESLDQRTDVFGLGAILCEMLTGHPPFRGSSREEIRASAARGDVADALGRLEACGADSELIELARHSLAAEPARRLLNAGHVARRIAAFLTGLQERLREAELARATERGRAEQAQAAAAQAEARARIERRARRLTLALAAAVLGLVVVAGGAGAYIAWRSAVRRAATDRGVTVALAEAKMWREQARKPSSTANLEQWSAAITAARHARELVAQSEGDVSLRDRVDRALLALEREQEEAKAERGLLDRLEATRAARAEHWDMTRADTEYLTAFREYGVDLDQLDPREAGTRLAQRSTALELSSYLDDWAFLAPSGKPSNREARRRRVIDVLRFADPDPWRNALRQHVVKRDLQALRRLAADEHTLEAQPVASLVLLAVALQTRGDQVGAESVLRRAWRRDPGNFWVNFNLAHACKPAKGPGRPQEEARFLTAAVAIRPRSAAAHDDLGNALNRLGRDEEAIGELREALRLKPDDQLAYNNLGAALVGAGRIGEAVGLLREAQRLDPNDPAAHVNLGNAFAQSGRFDEAVAEFRTALRLGPDAADCHANIGGILTLQGRLDEALIELQLARRLEPELATGRLNLGEVLRLRGQFEEAAVEYLAALRADQELPLAHVFLGDCLRETGDHRGALAAFRRAHELARSKNDPAIDEYASQLRSVEQEAAAINRLPAIVRGAERPKDDAERLAVARLCSTRACGLYDRSGRFYFEALTATPRLADDRADQHRYRAARAAALAGCGQGKDDPPLGEAAKTRWRKQAVKWLGAEVAAWSKVSEKGTPAERQSLAETLQNWKLNSDLAGLRDAAALAKLPQDERKACRALWSEVDALFKASATHAVRTIP